MCLSQIFQYEHFTLNSSKPIWSELCHPYSFYSSVLLPYVNSYVCFYCSWCILEEIFHVKLCLFFYNWFLNAFKFFWQMTQSGQYRTCCHSLWALPQLDLWSSLPWWSLLLFALGKFFLWTPVHDLGIVLPSFTNPYVVPNLCDTDQA